MTGLRYYPHMKKIILSAVMAVLFVAIPYVSQSKSGEKGVVKTLTPENKERLQQAMSQMEAQYLTLTILVAQNPLDDAALRWNLSLMKDAIRKAQKITENTFLRKQLKSLSQDVSQMNRLVGDQNPASLHKGVDRLYENCFRCHIENAHSL